MGTKTRWEVFEALQGKVGHRWYLWVTRSASVVFYRMAPGRGADVPKAHFAKLHKDLVDVVLVCDRYSAYKSLAMEYDAIVLAYCWAHVRRDFLNAARSWPELAPWMWKWIEDNPDALPAQHGSSCCVGRDRAPRAPSTGLCCPASRPDHACR
jgi:transposase